MPDEELQELTIPEVYERLVIEDDIILDQLASATLPLLRKGLSSYKTKLNEKAKKHDLPTEDRRIEFDTLDTNYKDGWIKVRVYFAGEKKFAAKIITSDKELKWMIFN